MSKDVKGSGLMIKQQSKLLAKDTARRQRGSDLGLLLSKAGCGWGVNQCVLAIDSQTEY